MLIQILDLYCIGTKENPVINHFIPQVCGTGMELLSIKIQSEAKEMIMTNL